MYKLTFSNFINSQTYDLRKMSHFLTLNVQNILKSKQKKFLTKFINFIKKNIITDGGGKNTF